MAQREVPVGGDGFCQKRQPCGGGYLNKTHREWYNPFMPVRIKICGITQRDDALAAARLGADAVGFNFYPRSVRYVSPVAAAGILRELPPFLEPVALFVNEPLPRILETVSPLPTMRTIQWHGDDPPVGSPPSFRFIPAFQVQGAETLTGVRTYLAKCRAANALPAAVLLDGHRAGEYGGTGLAAPWQLLADVHLEVPIILAGGLTPENVAAAIHIVRPYAVDVAGGVESSPGRKDAEKVRRFIDQARAAAAGI